MNCQSKRSFANVQSVFNIVRSFNILGVKCDVKQFHIAFDTPKTPFYLPNPETFFFVEFGWILSYWTFSQICRIWSNSSSMWNPSYIYINTCIVLLLAWQMIRLSLPIFIIQMRLRPKSLVLKRLNLWFI